MHLGSNRQQEIKRLFMDPVCARKQTEDIQVNFIQSLLFLNLIALQKDRPRAQMAFVGCCATRRARLDGIVMGFEVVITMAGGSHLERGYDIPKYEVVLRGRTLLSWSLQSLQQMLSPASNITFVCLEENKSIPFIESQLAGFDIGSLNFVELPKLTDGQATSAIAAKEGVADRLHKLLIFNIVTYVALRITCPISF